MDKNENNMKIVIKRIKRTPRYTEGRMYADNVYICDTLEPADKHLDSSMTEEEIRKYKRLSDAVGIKCAIPYGQYPLTITHSPKFNKYLPLICNVRGFEGIRIHEGNTVSATSGCVLVGQRSDPGVLLYTRKAVAKVLSLLKQNGNKATIIIGR